MNNDIQNITEEHLLQISNLQPDGWPDINGAFRFYLSHENCYPVCILNQGVPVSIGASIVFGSAAWLAHIITAETFRKRGFAKQIVEFLISDLFDKGIESISLIATDMGRPVYEKCGFQEDLYYLKMDRDKVCEDFSISPCIKKYNSWYRDECITLYSSVYGEERNDFIAEYLDSAFIYEENGMVSGIYLPTLEEGAITASSTKAGIALMEIRAMQKSSFIVPEKNYTALDFLRNNDYSETKRLLRMYSGKKTMWNSEHLYCRSSGKMG